MAQMNQPSRNDAPKNNSFTRREFLGIAAKGAAALALGIGEPGCMAPRYDVFSPTRAQGCQARLTEDVYRAFLNNVRRSPDYTAQISGRDGAVGHFSYRMVRREGAERVYRFERSVPLGERGRSPEVRLGPDSQSFMLPIEPVGGFASDVIVNTNGNMASLSYLNTDGSWEELSTALKDSPSGLRFEALYSARENRLVVLASPGDLEDGMPGFISTAALDLRTGRLEKLDFV